MLVWESLRILFPLSNQFNVLLSNVVRIVCIAINQQDMKKIIIETLSTTFLIIWRNNDAKLRVWVRSTWAKHIQFIRAEKQEVKQMVRKLIIENYHSILMCRVRVSAVRWMENKCVQVVVWGGEGGKKKITQFSHMRQFSPTVVEAVDVSSNYTHNRFPLTHRCHVEWKWSNKKWISSPRTREQVFSVTPEKYPVNSN